MTQRQPVAAFFPRKNRADLDYRQGLVSAVSERDGAGFAERWCARDRGSPAAGAGAGGASAGVPLIMVVSPLRPDCAIFRNTRSSAAAQASRPALPPGSSPDSRSARC